MKPFTFPPDAFAPEFKEKGYVHVRNGISRDFLEFAREKLTQCRLSGHNELPAREIKNKKKQYLFELPEDADFLHELSGVVSRVADLPAAQITLSERHIMVYDDNASSLPPLHKDRVASQVAVGIPLEERADARIALLPYRAREVNPMDNAIYSARATESFGPSAKGWILQNGDYSDREETGYLDLVELDVQPGDVVIFPGSSMYHARLNGAKSSVLYFKFNAMRLDPLREDPSTSIQRENGLRILEERGDEQLLRSVVELSPQLRRVSRHHTRLNWTSVIHAFVSGETGFTISEEDMNFLFALEGRRTVRDVLIGLRISEDSLLSHIPRIRRLGKLGGIDFLS